MVVSRIGHGLGLCLNEKGQPDPEALIGPHPQDERPFCSSLSRAPGCLRLCDLFGLYVTQEFQNHGQEAGQRKVSLFRTTKSLGIFVVSGSEAG